MWRMRTRVRRASSTGSSRRLTSWVGCRPGCGWRTSGSSRCAATSGSRCSTARPGLDGAHEKGGVEGEVGVVLEQLCELTGQELPAAMGEATREAWLLDLLGQAAAGCRAAGGRLVLVVDGLDEDRGVSVGPHAHSIAALLPADP